MKLSFGHTITRIAFADRTTLRRQRTNGLRRATPIAVGELNPAVRRGPFAERRIGDSYVI
jgi:hypothetical protein